MKLGQCRIQTRRRTVSGAKQTSRRKAATSVFHTGHSPSRTAAFYALIEPVKGFQAAQGLRGVTDLKQTVAELEQRLQASLVDRDELLQQQAATKEVLQVINASSGDLAPVFDAILERAMRLCEAEFGLLSTCDDGQIQTVSTRGVPSAFAEFRKNNPPVYGPGTGPARFLAGERVVHIVDLKSGELSHR